MGLLFPLHVAVKLSPAGTELGLAEIEAVVGAEDTGAVTVKELDPVAQPALLHALMLKR